MLASQSSRSGLSTKRSESVPLVTRILFALTVSTFSGARMGRQPQGEDSGLGESVEPRYVMPSSRDEVLFCANLLFLYSLLLTKGI